MLRLDPNAMNMTCDHCGRKYGTLRVKVEDIPVSRFGTCHYCGKERQIRHIKYYNHMRKPK